MATPPPVTVVCRNHADGRVTWTRTFPTRADGEEFAREQSKTVPVHHELEVWDEGVLILHLEI